MKMDPEIESHVNAIRDRLRMLGTQEGLWTVLDQTLLIQRSIVVEDAFVQGLAEEAGVTWEDAIRHVGQRLAEYTVAGRTPNDFPEELSSEVRQGVGLLSDTWEKGLHESAAPDR